MRLFAPIRRVLRPALPPTLSICLLGYFVYHSVQGENGFNAVSRLQQQVTQAEATLAALREERQYLEHRAELMMPQHVDPDMLDERARTMLNYANPEDVILYFHSQGGGGTPR